MKNLIMKVQMMVMIIQNQKTIKVSSLKMDQIIQIKRILMKWMKKPKVKAKKMN